MTSSSSRLPDLELRQRGNSAFRAGRSAEAVDLYTEAIEKDFDCSDRAHVAALLSNRAAALVQLKEFNLALCDAAAVRRIQPDWSRGYERAATIHKSLFDYKRASTCYETAAMRSTEPANAKKLYSLAASVLKTKTPNRDESDPLDYRQAKENCPDFDKRLAARIGYESWAGVEQALNHFCNPGNDSETDLKACQAIMNAAVREQGSLHFSTESHSTEQVRAKILAAYRRDAGVLLPGGGKESKYSDYPITDTVRRFTKLAEERGLAGPQGAEAVLSMYYKYQMVFAAFFSAGTNKESAERILRNLYQLSNAIEQAWPQMQPPRESGFILAYNTTLSLLNLVEYELCTVTKAATLQTQAERDFDIYIEVFSKHSPTSVTPEDLLDYRTRPLARTLLAQAYGLRARSQLLKNLDKFFSTCIWPNRRMLYAASALAKQVAVMVPEDDLDRVRALNLALVCDLWRGGLTIKEAFERVAKIERVKAYVAEFYGPCDEMAPDSVRIRRMMSSIHDNIHRMTEKDEAKYSQACFSVPEERAWLLSHTLKPVGLVEAKSINEGIDGDITADYDVADFMLYETDGQLELWDICTESWHDEL